MAETASRGLEPPQGSYLDQLACHARRKPHQVALYDVTPQGTTFAASGTTYAQLAAAANDYAALFARKGLEPGDRVLLSISAPDQLLAAFVGAIASGLVAVPLQTRSEFRSAELFRERVGRVAIDCRPGMAVVEDREAFDGAMQGGLDLPILGCLRTGAAPATPVELHVLGQEPSAPAFIQYTSGSTGDPRGVVITHENIAANTRGIGETTAPRQGDRVFSWLPLHHDMGLVGGLLYPTGWGLPTYVMAPIAFLLRPVRWLRAIQHFAITNIVAPTFAYALCCRKIPESQLVGLDLSSCRIAYCGAEPISVEVVRGFCERFAAYGFCAEAFYPVYGLAEATLAVSFPSPGEAPVVDWIERQALTRHGVARPAKASREDALGMVAVGRAFDRHALSIADPDSHQPCREREVGEIIATGPSVSPRYWGDDPATRRLALRTGDLGYLAEGRLYVVDRIKDLIIVAGQNFAPSDIERHAATAGVRLGRVAAIGVPGEEGTEQVHIMAELDPRSWRTQAAIGRDMRRRILDTFGLHVGRVTLVPPGALPRTSSGKLRRRACRDLHASGAYRDRVTWWRRVTLKAELIVHALQRAVLLRRARSTR